MISLPRIPKRRGRPIRVVSSRAATRWKHLELDRGKLWWRYCRQAYGRTIQALIFPLVLLGLGSAIFMCIFHEHPLKLMTTALAGGALTAVVDKLSASRK